MSVQKWLRYLAVLFVLGFSGIAQTGQGRALEDPDREDPVNVTVLRQAACPDCDRAIAFIKRVAMRDRWITITILDMKTSELAQSMHSKLLELFSVPAFEFPIALVGTHAVAGYADDQTTGLEIVGYIQECRWFGCDDMRDALGVEDEAIVEVRNTSKVRRKTCLISVGTRSMPSICIARAE